MQSVLDIHQFRPIVKMATRELLNFLKEFLTIKQDWPRKTPKQKYQFVYNIARFSLDLTGLRVLSDLRIVPMTFVTGAIVMSWAGLTMYTIVYFACQGRFADVLPCTCLLGIMTSVGIDQCFLFFELQNVQSIKIIFQSFTAYLMCTLGQRTKLVHLMKFPGNVIFLDSKELTAYNRICSRNLDGTFKRFLITISFVILSMGVGVFGPIYAYITTGARTSILGVKLPFFDEGSNLEFMFINVLQFLSGTFGIIGNISIESCSALLISLNQISVSICELDVEEITYQIEKEPYQTSIKSKILLRNILMRIQDVDKYDLKCGTACQWEQINGLFFKFCLQSHSNSQRYSLLAIPFCTIYVYIFNCDGHFLSIFCEF